MIATAANLFCVWLFSRSAGRVILFADNLHGQTTDEFQSVSMQQCNTLLWFLPAG